MKRRYRWVCQTNPNPYDSTENPKYTDYPDDISQTIEEAFQNNIPEILIRTGYRIDLKKHLQIHALDSFRRRPIRRLCSNDREITPLATISTDLIQDRLATRYGFDLESDSADVDTHYQGSPFIMTWFMKNSLGKSKLHFDRVFPLLIDGIRKELEENSEAQSNGILADLQKLSNESSSKKNEKRLKSLSKCCVHLYTKNSSLYLIINRTLRDNNVSKIDSLGPLCYFIYDYVGQQSIRNRLIAGPLHRILSKSESTATTVYRGDKVSAAKINRYRQAAGDVKQCFKWLCFVSTSRNRDVALTFAKNVFYQIDLGRYKSNDQFADIEQISAYPREEEILLRPGVRFRVDRVETEATTEMTYVNIYILPSYISTL